MTRTTIMLPPGLKSRAERKAGTMGISLGQLIRTSLERAVESSPQKQSVDPLLADDVVFADDGPRDLAENHDDYLYGDRR
ncbi:MAG: CopG family transcriptional regulator [Tepidisphaerales bacterium]